MGPLISPQAKARVESLIQSGVDEGANILLDGRNVNVKGYESGNFVGPTILSGVKVRLDERDNAASYCQLLKSLNMIRYRCQNYVVFTERLCVL